MFGFPRQSRDSCTTRLFLPAHAQTKVPSVHLFRMAIFIAMNGYSLLKNSWEICLSMRELKVRGRVKIACGVREI